RAGATEHEGRLGALERVISALPVLPAELSALCEDVARRYAGTRADVLRLAIPPRHARAESAALAALEKRAERAGAEDAPRPDAGGWERYTHGGAYLDAAYAGRAPRAVWQAMPGDDWALRIAEAACAVYAGGRSAVVIVPDRRDLARVV